MNKTNRERILFVVSEDWYFYSHRLYLAKVAAASGFKVGLLSHFSNHKKLIEKEGIITFNWLLKRSSKNIIKEITAIKGVTSSIKTFKPDIIHAVAMKPVLYSSIASYFLGLKNRVYALAGLGHVFTSNKKYFIVLRFCMEFFLKFLLKTHKTILILQNPEDQEVVLNAGIINQSHIRLIRGAGVDMELFSFSPIPKGIPIIILPSRMLWAKGILDFINCAKIINKDKKIARFILIGAPDNQNPDSIPKEKLEEWSKSDLIEWWGHQSDMVKVYHKSTIICLPTTYGEGLPKALLESASCARPIVTYDRPGCREIVRDRYNGFLVKPKDINDLANKISQLLKNPNLCIQMGRNGRRMVKENFTQEIIAEQTIKVWEELLAK